MDIESIKRGMLQKLQQVGTQAQAAFWNKNNPVATGLLNLQKATPAYQQGGQQAFGKGYLYNNQGIQNYVPQIQAPKVNNPILQTVANFGVGLANLPIQAGANTFAPIVNLATDVGTNIGHKVLNQGATPYQHLKSPFARLEYNALGQNNNPQQVVGNLAGAGLDILNMSTLKAEKVITEQAVNTAAKDGLLTALKRGSLQGGAFMGTQGFFQGLSDNRGAKTSLEQFQKGGEEGTKGFILGAVTGGILGTSGYTFGKLRNLFSKEKGLSPVESNAAAEGYIQDITTGRLLGSKKKVLITYMDGTQEKVYLGSNPPQKVLDNKVKVRYWQDVVKGIDEKTGIDKLKNQEGKISFGSQIAGDNTAQSPTPIQPGTNISTNVESPVQSNQPLSPEQILAKAEAEIKGAANISSPESVPQVSNRMDIGTQKNLDNSISNGGEINQPQLSQQPLESGKGSSSSLNSSPQIMSETGSNQALSSSSTLSVPESLDQGLPKTQVGSSERSIAQVPNSENPYFNTNNLNVSPQAKQKVNEVIQEVKPQIEQVVGKKLSNKEVIDTANSSAKVLNKVVDREQTADFTARLLKTRQQLAAAAESGTVTKEYIDNLIAVKSHATDIARKLQSFNIGADPKLVTSKDAILDAVLKVEKDSNKVIEAAKGVDFNDLKQATDFYRKFVKPSNKEWVDLIRYNSMLSSPNTHINNAFSNLTNTTVVAPIEKILTGTLDFINPVRRIQGKPQTQFASEGGAYLRGYIQNAHNAIHAFADVMRGKTVTGNLDVRQIPLSTNRRVSALNIPTRLLEASDQFFTTLTKGGEEAALNLRKSKGVNVGNIETQALDNAKYRLFRSELHDPRQGTILNSIDDFTGLIQKARNSNNIITSSIAKFTLPFVQTPMNILKQGIEYSPAGFATVPDVPLIGIKGAANKTEQLSKAIIGSAAVAGSMALITSGRTTWSEPTDPKKRAAFRAAGMQPYAVKVGDKWVSYQKLPPALSFPLAFLSSVYDAQANKKITDSQVNTILSAAAKFGNFFADQSYVKNIGDLVASVKGSPENMVKFVSNYPQQIVPFRALLGWMARITDPYQRQVNQDAGFLEKQVQQLFTQIPGLSMTVPARLGPDGNPIPNQNGMLNAFSPVRVTNENPDKKQYYDMLQQKTKNTRDINALKDAAAKGQDISGMIGQIGAEGPAQTNPMDNYKAQFEEDMVKQKIKLKGGSTFYNNKIIYSNNPNSVSEIDLNPPTKGNGIDAFVNSDWNITKAREVWNNQKITAEDKQKAWEILGVDPKDVRYDALANHNTDVSTQYIISKSADHVALLKNIITGRQESISGKQFASNAVIDSLVEQGYLSKEEAKQLKTLKYDKNGTDLSKATTSTSKGKKGKKLPLKKLTGKIPTVQSNQKRVTASKAPTLKTPKVSFDTQFSKSGAVPKAPKYAVKFNL